MKLYLNMKNFEEFWVCLLEQISNFIRGKCTQLVIRISGEKFIACNKNKWMDVGSMEKVGCAEAVTQR